MSIKDDIMGRDRGNDNYDKIQSLPLEDKLELLWKIRRDSFALANSFAGDETGGVAGKLHQASNQVMKVFIALADDDREAIEQMSRENIARFVSGIPSEFFKD